MAGTQNSWMYNYQQTQPNVVQQVPTQPAQGQIMPVGRGQANITPARPFQQLSMMPSNLPGNGELNPAYVKWKISAKYSDYMNARKFHTWKDACRGNVTDWKGYAKWRESFWDKLGKDAFYNDFQKWKNIFNWDDYMRWKGWCEWERVKDKDCGEKRKYRCKKDDKEKCKRRDEYKKFVVKAKIKVYAKFHKFRDWHGCCRNRGIEHTDFTAYYKWSKEYKYDNDRVRSCYDKWRNSPVDENDFEMWLLWSKWQKLREKAATMTDLNEKPDWYNGDKNYGGYRGYYGRGYGSHSRGTEY